MCELKLQIKIMTVNTVLVFSTFCLYLFMGGMQILTLDYNLIHCGNIKINKYIFHANLNIFESLL